MLETGAVRYWRGSFTPAIVMTFMCLLSALCVVQDANSLSVAPVASADQTTTTSLPENTSTEATGTGVVVEAVSVPPDYNIHQRPPRTTNDTVTKVHCAVKIMSVMDVNEINEEISLEINLDSWWKDIRLKHFAGSRASYDYVVLNPSILNQIWHPDLFIDGAKKISQPELMAKPVSLQVGSSGTVTHEGRWTATLACQMHFHYYPADTQKCSVDLRSYAYNTRQLKLVWSAYRGVTLQDAFRLPSFDVVLDSKDDLNIQRSIPRIRFTILLRRKLSYHLIQTYLPSSLFVFVSWLSFLIPAGSIPERLGCCMTTLLTLTAMFAAVRHSAPNVSYVKALDIWMITCIIFVFLTLLVHTVIFKLWSMQSKKHSSRIRSEPGSTKALSVLDLEAATDEKHDTHVQDENAQLQTDSNGTRVKSEVEPRNIFEWWAIRLEFSACIFIPALFIVFNFVYWPLLLHKSEYNRKLYSLRETGIGAFFG